MKAYPYMHKHPTSGQTTMSDGMDLRDWFAGMAMQGLLTIPAKELSNDLSDKYPRIDSYVSYLSFVMADAMIKAREVKDEQS
ncbi:MAG: hypothetical protein EBU08_19960 [Micrococcales bacterium]|nr:hypothetical protein [Micrococcales bacterium]